MKRGWRGRLALVLGIGLSTAAILGLVFSFDLGAPTYSDEKKFDVSRARVHVEVRPDATLRVTERLTYRFSDHPFRGAYRDIALQDGVRLTGVSVADEREGDYDPGGNTELGSSDAAGRFGTTTLPDGALRVVWHYDGQTGGEREFTIGYRVTGQVEAWDDVVLVHWAIWGDQWQFPLRELEGELAFDGGEPPIATWLRPAALARRPQQTATGARATLERSPEGTQVVLSALYPRSAFAGVRNARVHPGDGREEVIAREDDRSADGSSLRDSAWRNQWPIAFALVGLLALLTAWLVWRARERDPGVARHLAEPPEHLPPAAAYAIATEGGYDDGVVLATLLDLVDRGFYTGAAGPADPDDPRDDQLDLILSIPAERPADDGLDAGERAVLGFFDQLIGDAPGALSTLKDRIPEHDATWRSRWKQTERALRDSGSGERLLAWDRDLRPARILLAVLAPLPFLVLGGLTIARAGEFGAALTGIALALTVVLVPPGHALRRLSPAARERQARWAAFARWTKDFPRLHDDPPATLALWKRILVFGVAFGTAKAVLESGRIPPSVMAEAAGTWFAASGAHSYAYLGGNDFASSFAGGFSSQVAEQSSSGGGGGGGGGGSSGGGGGGAW